MTINQDILDSTIRHMVWVERYKTKEVKRILKILEQADDDLVAQIAARLTKIEARGYDLGVATTERLTILLDEIRQQRKEIMRVLAAESKDELTVFSEYEAEFQESVIVNSAKTYGVDLAMVSPAAAQLKAVVTSQPFQGRLLKEWFADLGVDTGRRLSDAVRIGIVEGQTTDQIVRRIRGTKAKGYADGVMSIGKRNAEAIVRTAISHVSSRASDELCDANADIIKGVKFVAVLDSRTSAICRSLDSKIFTVAKKPKLPLHFNERSKLIPYLGEAITKGLRASVTGSVPDDTTYGDWLRWQPVAVQNDILGVQKAQLFRKGGLPLDRFVDNSGKEYTLAELRSRDSEIWAKTF